MAKKKSVFDRVFFRLMEWISYGYALSIIIMGIEVVMRYGFSLPQIWVQDMVVMLVGSCFALGGIAVLMEDTHIRITSIYDQVSPATQCWLNFIAALVAMVYLSLVSYGAWINASESWLLSETTGTGWDSPLPMVLKSILLITTSLMTVFALKKMWCFLRNR